MHDCINTSKVGSNVSGQMGAKDCCNRRFEAATISEFFHLFGQENLTFIRQKSGKSQGILKTGVCGNHDYVNMLFLMSCSKKLHMLHCNLARWPFEGSEMQ